MRGFLGPLVLGLVWLQAGSAAAAEVLVAVAANFSAPMQRIAAAFEQATGHRAVLAFGATGKFYTQIRAGSPYQVLLAADEATPARLAAEGFADEHSRFTYATGRLVLWSARPGHVDAGGEVLRRGGSDRIALADPRVSPYGAAAMQVLNRLQLLPALQPRMATAQSVGQAHQFVATGNAALGFVALSQVVEAGGRLASGYGSGWTVPADWHAPLRQQALLLNPGRGQPAAGALLAFLRGETARAIIRAHGYEL